MLSRSGVSAERKSAVEPGRLHLDVAQPRDLLVVRSRTSFAVRRHIGRLFPACLGNRQAGRAQIEAELRPRRAPASKPNMSDRSPIGPANPVRQRNRSASRRRCSSSIVSATRYRARGAVLRLEEQVAVDAYRDAVEARIPWRCAPGPADLEREIAVGQVAVASPPRRSRRPSSSPSRHIRPASNLRSCSSGSLKWRLASVRPATMRRIDPDIMRVAQRFGVDDLEDVLDRPGQRQIDRQPFDRRAEIGDLQRAAGDLNGFDRTRRWA